MHGKSDLNMERGATVFKGHIEKFIAGELVFFVAGRQFVMKPSV
jgi:hypothetical protein